MRTRVNILKLSQQAAQLLVDALVPARIDDAEMSWGAPDLLKTALAHFVKVEVPKEPDLSRVFFAIEVIQRNDWRQFHDSQTIIVEQLIEKNAAIIAIFIDCKSQ